MSGVDDDDGGKGDDDDEGRMGGEYEYVLVMCV